MFLLDFSVDNERYAEKEGQYDDNNDRLHDDHLIFSPPSSEILTQPVSSYSKRICKVDDSICTSRRAK